MATKMTPVEREEAQEASWIKNYWRPAIAWQYFAVCMFDFLIAPILTGLYAYYTKIPYVPWAPITLQESAFYHISMGAIIGVAAFTRGREKVRKWQIESETEAEKS